MKFKIHVLDKLYNIELESNYNSQMFQLNEHYVNNEMSELLLVNDKYIELIADGIIIYIIIIMIMWTVFLTSWYMIFLKFNKERIVYRVWMLP